LSLIRGKGGKMIDRYQIEKDGQITIVNSKEEYETFKTKYNDYEFMIVERVNKIEAISKIGKTARIKQPSLRELILRIEADVANIKDVLERNNLR
jgi:hypothetical protein